METGECSKTCMEVDDEVDNEVDDEEDDDEDDPIVAEIPVFLSKRFQDQLNIFKFLNFYNPSKSPLDVRSSSIKPLNQIVKLELNLDQTSDHFSLQRAEEIAQEIESLEQGKKEKKIHFSEKIFDKVDFVSQSIQNHDNYVGIYNGNECHIVPVQGLYRFYPDFPHLIKSDKWKQSLKRPEVKADEPTEQQVTVKFSSNVTKTDTVNYKKMMSDIEAESYMTCYWHSESSQLNEWEKTKLFAENKDVIIEEASIDISEKELLSCIASEDKEKPTLASNVLSFSSLKGLPLLEQCKLLLKDGKIMSFQHLLALLSENDTVPAQNLLKVLPQIATLVQGNWIVKSEFLFLEETFSQINGVPANYMCQARDYVLSLFTKNEYLESSKASSVINLPNEELREIFSGIGKLCYGKGWELRLPLDTKFIEKYPNIVEQQNSMWAQREIQLQKFFSEKDNSETRKRKTKSVSEDSNKLKETLVEAKTEKRKAPLVARRKKNAS